MDASPERRMLVERSTEMMGTSVSIHLAVEPALESLAHDIAEECLAWLRQVDDHLSRFKPESELCRLNAAGGRWFAASPLLFDALAIAVEAAHASGGLFDPTLLPQLEALGYDRDFAHIAHREIVADEIKYAAPRATSGEAWRGIALDAGARCIRLPAGTRVDLGGIAKGWAADVALERYCGPCRGALVNVGGDLRARGGPQPGEGWRVGILGPSGAPGSGEQSQKQRQVATITFSRGGLATSGALRRWWRTGGVRRHHLLDPRTGLPAPLWIDDDEQPRATEGEPLLATATALAPTAARAEVAAKVALLRGEAAALAQVDAAWEGREPVAGAARDPSPTALLLTFGDGRLRLSAHLHEYLATWATEGAPVPYYVQRDGAWQWPRPAEAAEDDG